MTLPMRHQSTEIMIVKIASDPMAGRTEVEFQIFIKRNGRQLLGPGKIFLLREIHPVVV